MVNNYDSSLPVGILCLVDITAGYNINFPQESLYPF